jgi:hypothetical protein
VWNYLVTRAQALPVAYLNDSSVHEQMVRFAGSRISAGHLPQTSWFPYLGLGSPQFLHYQSLPATVTGLVGLATGGDRAYAWSLYLLWSLWPVSVYIGARAFRLGRWTSALAALVAPLLVSTVGVGYELGAYAWTGYGVWTQLWAMLALPLAWGWSWRAVAEGRRYLPAVAAVSLTVMLHFETGYLALIPLALFPFLSPVALAARLRRAAVVAVGSLAAAAWVIVPLLVYSRWAAVNEVLAGTPLENGYGARRVLGWLVSGQLLDAGRLPVVTVLAAIGLVACVARWRADERGRAVLVLLAMSLVLSFGRTTFGPLVDLLPGSTDVFMRRFMMGAQLAAVLLAGIGAAALGSFLLARARRRWPTGWSAAAARPWVRRSAITALAVVVLAGLAPAWAEVGSRARANATAIDAQRDADARTGVLLAPLLGRIQRSGGGRVYAGSSDNWGAHFLVGQVPVFKYLESADVDEVGYTLRTASLMTDPEYWFDASNPGDYTLFGIHWILTPAGHRPTVPAAPVMRRGPYALWELPSVGYVHVATVVGTVSEDRANLGRRSIGYLRSPLPGEGRTLLVDYAGAPPPAPRARAGPPGASAGGRVVSEDARLAEGTAEAVVQMRREAVVVLSASFDPGWHVTVDGRAATALMVAPALVAVEVGPGIHRVVFSYRGFGGEAPLLAAAPLVLAGVGLIDRRRRRRPGRRAGPAAGPGPGPP